MPYRTSRQDRTGQVNLEGGRRRKPVYRYAVADDLLTDSQRAERRQLEAARRARRQTDNERDAAGMTDADATTEMDADAETYRVWCEECDAVARQQAWNAAHAGNLDEMPF